MKKLEPYDRETGHVNAIIETPKGHRAKYKHDPKNDVFLLKSLLPAGMMFPFDFGFIPGTVGEDGDPLDILVLIDEPASQGCLVPTRLIAVIEADQTEEGETKRNDRLIGIAAASHEFRSVQSIEQLSEDLLGEIEHFFISYNEQAGKTFKPRRRAGADRARQLIEAARK